MLAAQPDKTILNVYSFQKVRAGPYTLYMTGILNGVFHRTSSQ